jgi:histidyl-tRNA synthetase
MEKPSLPKGTRDFGPATMAKRQFILYSIRGVFQKFGFLPLETPAMENLSTLTGKYGEEGDQLLFKILNSGDFLKDVDASVLETRNPRQVAPLLSEKGLRYDLTVPFARYVVMNRHEIHLPFKRYQIQPVWRADRPQKGRYREFYQCDADVVGTDSLICEAEIILMIKEVMHNLGIQDYTIRINHRSILNGIAEVIGASDKAGDLFVAMDKLDKVGEPGVREELSANGYTPEQLTSLFSLLTTRGTNLVKLQTLTASFGQSSSGQKGVHDLTKVLDLLNAYGATDEHVELDTALARGLSYYTGCIFEVKINHVSIGSVSGGGRYDNLTQAFGSKEQLSGVGISFGIDRLYDALEELDLFPKQTRVSSTVLVCHFDEETRNYGLKVLAQLREAGIASEIYPDLSKLKKQLDYANKKMIGFVLVVGEDEMKSGELACKHMETGEQEKLSLEKIIYKLTR